MAATCGQATRSGESAPGPRESRHGRHRLPCAIAHSQSRTDGGPARGPIDRRHPALGFSSRERGSPRHAQAQRGSERVMPGRALMLQGAARDRRGGPEGGRAIANGARRHRHVVERCPSGRSRCRRVVPRAAPQSVLVAFHMRRENGMAHAGRRAFFRRRGCDAGRRATPAQPARPIPST